MGSQHQTPASPPLPGCEAVSKCLDLSGPSGKGARECSFLTGGRRLPERGCARSTWAGPSRGGDSHVLSNVDVFISPDTFSLSRRTPFSPMPKMSSERSRPDLGFLPFPVEQFVTLVFFSGLCPALGAGAELPSGHAGPLPAGPPPAGRWHSLVSPRVSASGFLVHLPG